jgi:transposase-like protein
VKTKDYQTKKATGASAAVPVPDVVQLAMGDIAETMREGLLALAVGAGMQVIGVLFEESVTALAGPKGKHDPARTAVRHGSEDGSVVLGGRKVAVRRPRVRSAEGERELAVPAYQLFSSTDLLGEMAVARMRAGLSTRRYRLGLEPAGEKVEQDASGTSKSAVSRRFVELTSRALEELLAADLSPLGIVAVFIDGFSFGEHLMVAALGVDAHGYKHPLGVIEGATENAGVVRDLLADLQHRGLDCEAPMLVVIDGSKALAAAAKRVFRYPAVQRCRLHQERDIGSYLPERERPWVRAKLRAAFRNPDAKRGLADAEALAGLLAKAHPSAAASLREGLVEMFTITRLGLPPAITATFMSTNAVESMIEICREHSRNVKRWRDGGMALRWAAAGMLEAAKQFRRVKGFKAMPQLRASLYAYFDLDPVTTPAYDQTKEVAA